MKLLVLACALAAADAAPLSADEAVSQALAHAPELAAQRAMVAREEARASRIEIDPLRLRFDHRAVEQVFGARTTDDGTPYGPLDRTYWGVGVRPPSLTQLGFDQSVDARRASALALDVEAAQRTLAADVRLLHAAALLRREEVTLVEEALAVGGRMRDAVRAKLDAQAATAIDASAAELELLDLQLELDDVDAQRARAEARLARLTAAEAPVRAAGALPACVAPPDTEALLVHAKDTSPRLRAIGAREAALDAEAVTNALRFVPWIDEVTFGYLNQPPDRRDELRAIVELDVPVFAFLDGRGSDLDLRRARLRAERAEAEAELADNLAAAVERQRAAAQLVERHRAATDEVTARSLAAVDAALQSGNLDVVAAAEVYARALKSRRAHLRARERCAEATIELLRLTGDVLGAPGPDAPAAVAPIAPR